MKKFAQPVAITPDITLGDDKLLLIAGTCIVENEEITFQTAKSLKKICSDNNISLVFKAPFDKANRTSADSFRSLGMSESLAILAKVKKEFGLPILTDVHETIQMDEVAKVADILQIPAFLCRQTDLLIAAAQTGKAVNVKKGQFMAPEDMQFALEKVRQAGNPNVFLTERGFSFGYHNLVVDMRSLPIMRQFSPVVFDVTHSVQMPGGAGGKSGGKREFAPFLARAAAAVGVDGFFIETHPNPDEALSDGPNMIPLAEMDSFVKMLLETWQLGRKYTM